MDADKALNRAAAYCSRQERCISDVIRKLEQWDVLPDEFGAIIERLIKDNFIDEERYATFFTRDKFRFNGWGKIKISWALKQKSVDEKAIAQALDEIDTVEYNDKLKYLISNKFKQMKEPDRYKAKSKLVRFAQSRGFEADLVYPVVEQLISENYE
ncbi:MAG: RecX family transcriptional regulator [Chlorobi bacterium]|nr:RecX family transcriptional regulator [Chlorobiota bacterium]